MQLDESSGVKSNVLNYQDAINRQERGFRAGETKKTETKQNANNRHPVTSELPTSEDFQDALRDVRNDASSTRWILAGYEGGDIKNPLSIIGRGEGDIEELKEKLDYEQVLYGLYRVIDKVDDIETVKFVYICW